MTNTDLRGGDILSLETQRFLLEEQEAIAKARGWLRKLAAVQAELDLLCDQILATGDPS